MRHTSLFHEKRNSFMLACFDPIDRRSAEVGTVVLEEFRVREQLVLQCLVLRLELSIEFLVKADAPRHFRIMYQMTYGCKSISSNEEVMSRGRDRFVGAERA